MRRSRSRGRGNYNPKQNGYYRNNQRQIGNFRGSYRGNVRQTLHEDGGQTVDIQTTEVGREDMTLPTGIIVMNGVEVKVEMDMQIQLMDP